LISGSTALTVNIYNNLIGNLPITATGTDIVRGIGVISTGTFSNLICIIIPYIWMDLLIRYIWDLPCS
jgi:hypothetical protein